MMRRLVLSSAVAVCLASAWPALALDPGPDPYGELNRTAREAYGAAKAQVLRPDQAVFIVSDKLTLLKGGQSWSETFTPALYTNLKSLSHIPLGLFAVSSARGHSPDDPQWNKHIATLRDFAKASLLTLDQHGFSDAQKGRLRDLMERSIAYADRALAEPKADLEALRDYARAVAPATLANAAEAAKARLNEMHRAVNELRTRLEPGEWEKAYALILAPKTPRVGNLEYEYFVNAMGPGSAEKRVIYAESIFDSEVALGLLRTLLIDRSVAEAFYGDSSRMERDLLADGATAELLRMFGRLGQ